MFRKVISLPVCFASLLECANFYPRSYHLTICFLNLWFMENCIRFIWGMWQMVQISLLTADYKLEQLSQGSLSFGFYVGSIFCKQINPWEFVRSQGHEAKDRFLLLSVFLLPVVLWLWSDVPGVAVGDPCTPVRVFWHNRWVCAIHPTGMYWGTDCLIPLCPDQGRQSSVHYDPVLWSF